ncbi:MAG: hypothetical protein U9R72_02110 [Chloroflexota bacterium]|nr:hypothetical protein [Chloroflexota bacterium]
MINQTVHRIRGALLILIGALGIALSALGVITVWRAAYDVAVAADESLILLSDTLQDIDHSLDVASSTLDGAAVAMDGIYTTTLDVSRTLSTTRVTIEEMAGLAEHDLPQSIESSLVALDALKETAGGIDRILRALRVFGIGDYNPEMPLDQAVEETHAGLEPVPDGLRAMGNGLHEASASLEDVRGGLVLMGGHVVGIQENVVDADGALRSHRRTMRELQRRVAALRKDVDRPIKTVAWGATLLLIWIGLSQLAIVRWGIDLWANARGKV